MFAESWPESRADSCSSSSVITQAINFNPAGVAAFAAAVTIFGSDEFFSRITGRAAGEGRSSPRVGGSVAPEAPPRAGDVVRSDSSDAMVERISSRTDSADKLRLPDMACIRSILRVPGVTVNPTAQDTAQAGHSLTRIARGLFATRIRCGRFPVVRGQQNFAVVRSDFIGRTRFIVKSARSLPTPFRAGSRWTVHCEKTPLSQRGPLSSLGILNSRELWAEAHMTIRTVLSVEELVADGRPLSRLLAIGSFVFVVQAPLFRSL